MSGNIPTSTKWTRDAVDDEGRQAIDSVYLIANRRTNSKGTGFLLQNKHIITNEHVVQNAGAADIVVKSPYNVQISISNIITDRHRDLAILTPQDDLTGGLEIIDTDDLKVGTQVSTWGHPLGYSGPAPILSVGYLAGFEQNRYGVKKLTVNGAFNGGNSGGPLFASGTSDVVGVVVSKHAPFTEFQQDAIEVMSNQEGTGVIYTATDGTGNEQKFTEAQLVGDILDRMVDLTQVMIGHAIDASELRRFLKENRIS